MGHPQSRGNDVKPSYAPAEFKGQALQVVQGKSEKEDDWHLSAYTFSEKTEDLVLLRLGVRRW
jgi:hypothetical protein